MSPVKIIVGNNFRLYLDGNCLQTNALLVHVVIYRNICLLKSNQINLVRVYQRSSTVFVHFKG